MFKELGLGVLLMLGGDSNVARSAGDALIADRIDEALEEGGFEQVGFQDWSKGYEGSRFWVQFSDIHVLKSGADLRASRARVFPLSLLLRFDKGHVEAANGAHRWHFAQVEVDGSFGLGRRALSIDGWTVESDDRGRRLEAACLFGVECGDGLRVEATRFERLQVALQRHGRVATVELGWRQASECTSLSFRFEEVPRSASLAGVGRRLLSGEFDGAGLGVRETCDEGGEVGERNDFPLIAEGRWSERNPALDELLSILLVTVPDSYEYLVE